MRKTFFDKGWIVKAKNRSYCFDKNIGGTQTKCYGLRVDCSSEEGAKKTTTKNTTKSQHIYELYKSKKDKKQRESRAKIPDRVALISEDDDDE